MGLSDWKCSVINYSKKYEAERSRKSGGCRQQDHVGNADGRVFDQCHSPALAIHPAQGYQQVDRNPDDQHEIHQLGYLVGESLNRRVNPCCNAVDQHHQQGSDEDERVVVQGEDQVLDVIAFCKQVPELE